MEQAKKSACCSQSKAKLELVTIDPICGMTVAEDSERYFDFEAKRYLFCCDGCKSKFAENPEKYLAKTDVSPVKSSCCGSKKAEAVPEKKSCCGTQAKTEVVEEVTTKCCGSKSG